jgi:hypothetical protein
MRRTRWAAGLILIGLAAAGPASGSVVPSPSTVTLRPGATSGPIDVALTWSDPAPSPPVVGVLQLELPAPLVGKVGTIPNPVTYLAPGGSTSSSTSFQLVTSTGTPAGAWSLRVRDLTNQAGVGLITLIVPGAPPPPPPPPPPGPPPGSPPEFQFALTPTTIDLLAGGVATALSLRTLPDDGFADTVAYSIAGLPPFLVASSPAAARPPGYSAVSLSVRAAAAAPPGTYVGRVVATAGALRRQRNLTIRVTPAPGFTATIQPDPLALRIGGGAATATVATAADAGYASAITYSVTGLPAFVATGGSRVAMPPAFAPQPFSIVLLPGAVAGTYAGNLRAVAGGQVRQFPFSLSVLPAAPVVRRVVPAQVTTGGRFPLRLLGENFAEGAQVTTSRAGLHVESVRVLSPNSIEVGLLVTRAAPTGRADLVVTNPAGERSTPPGLLVVYSADSPAAPFGVSSVAIVHPRPGAQLGAEEAILPQAVASVSGSGMLIGSWRLDGVPFARFAVPVVAGRAAQVTSDTPIPQSHRGRHRLGLVVEHPRELSSGEMTIIQVSDPASELRLLEPEDGAVAGPEPPLFRWSPVPGAEGYEVELTRGDGAPTLSARSGDTEWRPAAEVWATVGDGPRAWRVRPVFPGETSGTASDWRALAVSATAAAPADDGVATPNGGQPAGPAARPADHLRPILAALRRPADDGGEIDAGDPGGEDFDELAGAEEEIADAAGEPLGTWQTRAELPVTTFAGDEPREAHAVTLALSGQTDLTTDRWTASSAGDLSFVGELEGGAAPHQESESWLAGFERQGTAVLGVRGGYAPPDFLDQLEFVSGGLSQGGGAIAFGRGGWRLRYHQAFDPQLGGVAGSDFGPEQQLRAGALTFADPAGRYDLRLVGLEVEEAAGEFAPGGDGDSVGLFAQVALGGSHTLVVEGARGRFASADPDADTADGMAFRLGLQGMRGNLQYGLDLRHVDAGFVNPANGGMSFGAGPDRDSLDLSLNRTFAVSNLSFQLQHVRGGDAYAPNSRVSAASLAYSRPLGTGSLAANAGYDRTDADADPAQFIPQVSRSGWTLGLSLDQPVRTVQLSESFTYQSQRDAIDPDNGVDTALASLRASGTASERLQLAGGIDATRVDGGPFQGRTDTWTLSFQPALELPAAWLVVSPYLARTAIENELLALDSTLEAAQMRLTWSPPWHDSLLGLEAAADWNRTRDASLPESGSDVRYSLALTLSWGAEGEHRARSGAPEQSAAPPPLVRTAALAMSPSVGLGAGPIPTSAGGQT